MLRFMAGANWRDFELERMLENSREAVRRSRALIDQTEKLLEESRILLNNQFTAAHGWPNPATDPSEP